MKIVIETIPHAAHRYPTVGDWWRDPDGTLRIRVSRFSAHIPAPLGNPDNEYFAFLIALHELIEVTLCERRGITQEAVDAFDMATTAHDSPWADDPGNCPEAPYHKEHVFAECIERLMARELGVNWQLYEAA